MSSTARITGMNTGKHRQETRERERRVLVADGNNGFGLWFVRLRLGLCAGRHHHRYRGFWEPPENYPGEESTWL